MAGAVRGGMNMIPPIVGDDRPVRLVQPGRGGHKGLGLREAFAYRELFLTLIWRNLTTRYRQMALGVIWVIMEPLAQMVLISVFFGMLFRLPSDGIPYPIFVLSALLPWTFFSRTINESSTSLRENIGLMSKVYFPRILLPFTNLSKVILDTAMSYVILLVVMLIFGFFPQPQILLLPVFLGLALVTGLGVGLICAVTIVRFRDITYLVNLALQVWMYLSPIVYSPSMVPSHLRPIYEVNPLYWVIEGCRWSLLGKPVQFGWQFAAAWGISLAILVAGLLVFARYEQKTVDYE
jgi:lipopolysaccharide transport system permease protein